MVFFLVDDSFLFGFVPVSKAPCPVLSSQHSMKQKMKRHTLKHLGEMRQKKRSETKEHGKEKRNENASRSDRKHIYSTHKPTHDCL